jgi:hypothetical protein
MLAIEDKVELFELEKEMTEYTYKVFNYFQYKINNMFTLNLSISMAPNTTVMGSNIFDRVYVDVYTTIMYHNKLNFMTKDKLKNLIKFDIIYTVVHEMFHSCQDMDHVKYNHEDDYIECIEGENEFMSYSYIYDNMNIISRDLDVYIDPEYVQGRIHIYFSKYKNNYTSASLFEYYISVIVTILHGKLQDECKLKDFKDYHKIIFQCNNSIFTVKDGKDINTDANLFNSIIAWYVDYSASRGRAFFKYDEYTDTLTIVVQVYDFLIRPVTISETDED